MDQILGSAGKSFLTIVAWYQTHLLIEWCRTHCVLKTKPQGTKVAVVFKHLVILRVVVFQTNNWVFRAPRTGLPRHPKQKYGLFETIGSLRNKIHQRYCTKGKLEGRRITRCAFAIVCNALKTAWKIGACIFKSVRPFWFPSLSLNCCLES